MGLHFVKVMLKCRLRETGMCMNLEPELIPTTLIKRYKRFLADVSHPEMGEFTVHCPNTGSMKNCWREGWTAWLLDSNNPKRKYRYTWVLSEDPQKELIGVNTHFANNIVVEAIQNHQVEILSDFERLETEVKYGEENSRIDVLLSDSDGVKTFVEVKSVTLREGQGDGFFPDAVSVRGQKHLRELMSCVASGDKAVLFFLVQHSAIERVKPAEHIDPKYAELIKDAQAAGVKIIAYNTRMSASEISLEKELPVII